jgi:hypothetical protein
VWNIETGQQSRAQSLKAFFFELGDTNTNTTTCRSKKKERKKVCKQLSGGLARPNGQSTAMKQSSRSY